jgi:hypothetical protein
VIFRTVAIAVLSTTLLSTHQSNKILLDFWADLSKPGQISYVGCLLIFV